MAQAYILIVEDDRFQQLVVESMIDKLLGLPAVSVSDGKQALQQVNALMPSMIICDLHMPKLDGIDFLFELAKLDQLPAICILSSMDKSIQRSVVGMGDQLGIKNIQAIQKPLTVDKLESTLALLDLEHTSSKIAQTHKSHQFGREDLIAALDSKQFVSFFQPQVDVHSHQIVGAESLVRWQHPTLGTLSPFHFISQISDYGLDFELFKQVCKNSIKFASQCRLGAGRLPISINATPSDLCHPDCLPFIFTCLAEHEFAEEYLTIELTESEVVKDMKRLLHAVNKLRIQGVNLAIDDFGTGNSSLSQIISSPFTELKIDLSFVREMLVSDKHFAAVSSSSLLAKQIGLKVVAEGVESHEQAVRLAELSCDVLQGYYFSKPLEEQAFLELEGVELS